MEDNLDPNIENKEKYEDLNLDKMEMDYRSERVMKLRSDRVKQLERLQRLSMFVGLYFPKDVIGGSLWKYPMILNLLLFPIVIYVFPYCSSTYKKLFQ
eukprot:UN32821